ncbi:MAG: YkgJ family cysteine cluster protein [Candidatus Omnitrophota bacterium]
MKMFKQFIPQEACLKCQGCCRFSQEVSLWSPCLLDEEIQYLLDKEIPPVSISIDKKIQPIPHPAGEGFICPFLDAAVNKCKIYAFRPFECRLYPFLIALRGGKVLLQHRKVYNVSPKPPPDPAKAGSKRLGLRKSPITGDNKLSPKAIFLTVDLNCSYIREKLNTKELKEYTQELINFLNTPAQVEALKDNPQIIQAYEDVLDIIELKIA